ncbi:MAG: DUF1080 domain-containing protein [Planctomycetes bacterium]|nr:DUF1080 domain-containing protein [Planctomycetota bacterium]
MDPRVSRIVVVLALLSPLAPAQDASGAAAPARVEPQPTFTLTPDEIAAGWQVLFDGTSTGAWRGYGRDAFPAEGWVAEDGALHHVARGGGGDLITRRRYANFELALDWKVAPGANSGIMYRVAETDQPSYYTGPEYQILDDLAHGDADGRHTSGALYGLYAAHGRTSRSAGEWNTARIRIVGQRVEHFMNGAKVVDATIGSDDWAQRVADSKFAPWTGFGVHRRGHVCLQDHGDEVWYRNIRIRELDPEPARLGEEVVLFDGASLDAFSAYLREPNVGMADVWSIQDGVLVCKGQPAGYIYTKEQFEDFVLTVRWRWNPEKGAGNSGVLLRMTGEHKVWPRSIEAQLQSGNAGDFWNIGNVTMSVAADRTNGRNTKHTHGAERPLGEWNVYQIVCDDGWVRLRVNGEVLNEAWDCEDMPGAICLQSEGAEIHFKEVRLRRLRPAQ